MLALLVAPSPYTEAAENAPQKSAKAHKAKSSIHLIYSIGSSFQLTCESSFSYVFKDPNGGKPRSKKAKTLATKAKTATKKSNKVVTSSQATIQPNRFSSLPINVDEDAGEENIQK